MNRAVVRIKKVVVAAGCVGLRVGVQGIGSWLRGGFWNHFQREYITVNYRWVAGELCGQHLVLHHLFKGSKGAVVRVVVLNLYCGDRFEVLQSGRLVSGLLCGFESDHCGSYQDPYDGDHDHKLDEREARFV